LIAIKAGPFEREAAGRFVLLPYLVFLLRTKRVLWFINTDQESRRAKYLSVHSQPRHFNVEEADRLVLLPDLELLLPTKRVLWFLDLDPESRRATGFSLTARKKAADRLVPLADLVLL
jgi:hypothetical protein